MPEDYSQRFAAIKGLKLLMEMKIAGAAFPTVLLADGTQATSEHFKYLLVCYGRQAKADHPVIDREADIAAAELDRESLQSALEKTALVFSFALYPALLLPYCRYASGRQIKALHTKIGKWSNGDAQERKAVLAAWNALLLSDTREAMLYADKQGLLERYAEMRGTDADTLRDTVLAEFGLDASGKKVYELGTGTVTVSLNADLSLELFDETAGKAIKSIPKKNADPEKYEAAKVDFAELKKNVKQVAKNRSDRLFQAFLTGKEFKAADWKAVYLHNPVLNAVGRLIVWVQGDRTFTLTASGPADTGLQDYSITDEPIRIAHPMEMPSADTEAWQKFFASRGLKQPFLQVWEPVHAPEEIKPDRYAGCMIPYYRFYGQIKHGISIYDFDFHDNIDITLNGCSAEIERVDWQRHELNMDDRFEVRQFGFAKYARQVNHIVAYLDRVTVWNRVRKDDISVIDLMPGFTLAQITEFIAAAQEANATNILAALLEYKNAHFADFDPMDEFTLEW